MYRTGYFEADQSMQHDSYHRRQRDYQQPADWEASRSQPHARPHPQQFNKFLPPLAWSRDARQQSPSSKRPHYQQVRDPRVRHAPPQVPWTPQPHVKNTAQSHYDNTFTEPRVNWGLANWNSNNTTTAVTCSRTEYFGAHDTPAQRFDQSTTPCLRDRQDINIDSGFHTDKDGRMIAMYDPVDNWSVPELCTVPATPVHNEPWAQCDLAEAHAWQPV